MRCLLARSVLLSLRWVLFNSKIMWGLHDLGSGIERIPVQKRAGGEVEASA